VSGVQSAPADDARQQRGFAASARSQQAVSVGRDGTRVNCIKRIALVSNAVTWPENLDGNPTVRIHDIPTRNDLSESTRTRPLRKSVDRRDFISRLDYVFEFRITRAL